MPVPVAVTHSKDVGNAGAVMEELQTAGPFARQQQSSASAETAPKAQQSGHPNGSTTPVTSAGTNAVDTATHQSSHVQAAAPPQPTATAPAIETRSLTFRYPGIDGRPLPGAPCVVQDMTVQLAPGSRCLLIGPNGAGKTSLLRILAGKHKVPEDAVHVLGRPPFYATELTTSGDVAYIGGNWERDVAFAGYSVPLQGGFSAGEMLSHVPGIDGARRERLIRVLDVDPDWQMNKVSDGQRRRVQIAMGLLRPFKVLLLDEVTVDLDVLGRSDLMRFLALECDEAGATIVYATHIFDGLESWPTHLMYLANGTLKEFAAAAQFPELAQGRLLSLVERWLRVEKAEQKQRRTAQPKGPQPQEAAASWNNGWAPGRLTSTMKQADGGQAVSGTLRHSSNTVLRM